MLMSKKNEKIDDEFEEFSLSEFGVDDEEVLDVRNMSEKNNLSILSKRLKNVNLAVGNIEDALYEIIWNLDNIIEESENNGTMFQNDCQEATEKILELIEASHQMLQAFESMKKIKDNISK